MIINKSLYRSSTSLQRWMNQTLPQVKVSLKVNKEGSQMIILSLMKQTANLMKKMGIRKDTTERRENKQQLRRLMGLPRRNNSHQALIISTLKPAVKMN